MGETPRVLWAFGVRFLLALGVPWLWIQIFQGHGTVEFFLSWSLWVVFLGGLLHYSKNKNPIFPWILGVVYVPLLASGMIIFFTMAAFSPVEAYVQWLKALQSGPAPGIVSFHLGILLGFLTTVVAALSWGVGLKGPLLFLGLVASAAGLVLVPHPLWVVGMGGTLVGLGLLAVGGGRPQAGKWKLVRESLLLPAAAAVLALPLFFVPFRNIYEAPRALEVLQPLAQEFVNPEIWAFVDDQEGLGARIYNDSLPPRIKSPLLQIRGTPETTYYLRAQIFDFYTGTQWQRFPQVNRAPWRNLRIKPGFQSNLELEVTAELLPLIPHTLNTRDIQVAVREGHEPVLGQFMPQGVRLEVPLRRGDRILLQRGTGGPWESDPQREMNLQGLGNLSPGVRALFQGLERRPDQEPPVYAWSIRRFLTENYTYALRNPGGNGSPLERFLLGEKTGWSSHFASAAVMLLRHGGIPARLVKGYLAMTDASGYAEVTTLHQHQWAEFYWDRFGWLPLETCPPFQPGGDTAAQDVRTRDQIALITGQPGDEAPVTEWGALVWLLSLSGVAGASLLLFVLRRFRHRPRLTPEENPLKQVFPPLRRLVVLATRIRQLKGPQALGWIGWTASWGSMKKWMPGRLKTLILSRQFGSQVWTDRDRNFLKKVGDRLSSG